MKNKKYLYFMNRIKWMVIYALRQTHINSLFTCIKPYRNRLYGFLNIAILLIIFIILDVFIACKDSRRNIDSNVIQFENNLEVKDVLRLSDITSNSKFLKVKSNEYAIGDYSKIVYYDSLIFICDNLHTRAIYIMDSVGTITHAINHLGKGPGEYVSIRDFSIDTEENNVVIYDSQRRKIMYYTFEGEFVKEVVSDEIVAEEISILNNQKVLFYSSINKNRGGDLKKNIGIITFDPINDTYETFYSFEKHKDDLAVKGRTLTGMGNDIAFTPISQGKLYNILENQPKLLGELNINKNNYEAKDIMTAYLSDKYWFLMIREGEMGYLILYDSFTGKNTRFSGVLNDINGFIINDYFISNNKFIAVIDPTSIIEFDKYSEKLKAYNFSEEKLVKSFNLQKKLKVDINDNPLIMICDLE